jgi:hypothetical protein
VIQPDCEEANRLLVGRRGNPIHPLRHSEERIMRRGNPILLSIYKEKMRSSRLLNAKPEDGTFGFR